MRDWIIFRKKEILFFLIIFLVVSLSFGLGYLLGKDAERAPILIEKRGG